VSAVGGSDPTVIADDSRSAWSTLTSADSCSEASSGFARSAVSAAWARRMSCSTDAMASRGPPCAAYTVKAIPMRESNCSSARTTSRITPRSPRAEGAPFPTVAVAAIFRMSCLPVELTKGHRRPTIPSSRRQLELTGQHSLISWWRRLHALEMRGDWIAAGERAFRRSTVSGAARAIPRSSRRRAIPDHSTESSSSPMAPRSARDGS
jgi:hypothetical protein